MEFCEADRRILEALALAKGTHAELKPLLDFYEALYRVQFEIKRELDPVLDIACETVYHERMSAGEILLTFEQLHVETARFVKLVRNMSCLILENSPGWELPSQPIDPGILTDIARHWFDSGEPVIGNGPPTTLVTLAVGFVLSSYLQKAMEILVPMVHMAEWRRNICPICGGKPGFAVLSREDGSRSLFCPRCHNLWPYRRTTCPFCENDEGIVYYPGEDQTYRLYICPECKHYIKTMDLRRTAQVPLLPVERILTVCMDLAAQEEGYLYC